MLENETMTEGTSIAEGQNEVEADFDLPEPDLLEEGLGSYEQSGNWQDVYAGMLQELSGNEFYLCDIDESGIPELLIGGLSTDTDKYSEFNVYTYKDSKVECIGKVATLRFSSLWLDDNCGILGYSYGAGSGGTYRYCIDNGFLNYDDEVSGYYYDGEGNHIEWFRGKDGSEIIVTEENRNEYDESWKSLRELERYVVVDETIRTVIYGGE